MKTNFHVGEPTGKSLGSGPIVSFSFEIEARGTKFWSELRIAQIQNLGKFFIGPIGYEEQQFWSEETIARLSLASARMKDVTRRWNAEAYGENYVGEMDSHTLADALSKNRALRPAWEQAMQQLESLGKEMATPDFLDFWNQIAIPLNCEDSCDERFYVLYRGTVWSCVRELEPEQWKLLADRSIEQEDMELAAALAGGGSSEAREGIPTNVRRAVWIRDQGKCARCGSRERLEFDHIVPLARGGSNTERNIELLCEVCNRAKSDSIM